jgi:acetyl esterase/lipase
MSILMTRRDLLNYGATISTGLLFHHSARGQSTETQPKTYTYKTVGNLAIKLDVYRRPDDVTRAAVVWIHGGALIGGNRSDIDRRVRKHVLEAGHVLISLDYRLAPETKLEEIVHDVEDAFVWIRRNGARLFSIDPKRIAVAGGSAGGYLTLTSGFRVRPRPAVLFSLYGYGDLVGDWYSTPSPHPRHHHSKLTREEAFGQVSGPAISDARDRKGDGGAFYEYCRQTGTWPKAVSGWDPNKEPERFHPFMPVKNVTAEYPPTVLIHGTSDTDVPYDQSVLMADQFKQHKVPHELISIPNGEHGLRGGDPKLIDEAYAKAFAFVDERLKKQ